MFIEPSTISMTRAFYHRGGLNGSGLLAPLLAHLLVKSAP